MQVESIKYHLYLLHSFKIENFESKTKNLLIKGKKPFQRIRKHLLL